MQIYLGFPPSWQSAIQYPMMARNHIPFAMASWWLVALVCKLPIDAHTTMAAAIGGLTPDLDHPRSALGRRIPILSYPLARIFGHRGFTHSLLAAGLLFLVLLTLISTTLNPAIAGITTTAGQGATPALRPMLIPFIIGYLSHIFGDSMTPSGVPLFWPRKRTYSFNLFKTWSWQETAFVGVFVLSVVFIGGVAEIIIGDVFQPSDNPIGAYFYGLGFRKWGSF